MSSRLAVTLEVLSDGKWHKIEELQKRIGVNEHQTQEIVAFLNSYNLATIDGAHKKVKANRQFREFLTQTTT